MREFLRAQFDVEGHQKETNTFRGVASVFGVHIDAAIPSVIHPGAFKRTLAHNRSRVRILWQHDDSEPIGIPTAMRETDIGLEVEGRISDTARGRDALTLMRDGVVTDLSIGFDAIKFEFDKPRKNAPPVRHIHEVRLWEFSPVTWGANEPAKIAEVNAYSAPVEVILERFQEHVASVDLDEALALLCGPLSKLEQRGTLSETVCATVSEAIHALNGLLLGTPEAEPVAQEDSADTSVVTVRRQSDRLAALAMAEAQFGQHYGG